MPLNLPFNKSSLQGRELEFIFQTISNGEIAGDQMFSKKCHGLLEQSADGGLRRSDGG
jgi:dTDP-4-amino-4,6-dideoxygalactose transaminase